MKRFTHTSLLLLALASASAQENVTTKYVENPSFEARFAGWTNSDFCFCVNDNFTRKSGIVYMQRQATSGNKIKNADIHQSLIDLPTGTYTLTADCQLIQQADESLVCSGATLYAGNESAVVNECKTYSVVFTVIDGKADIGFKTAQANGNWAAIDNVQLYYNGVNADSLHVELQRIISDAESYIVDTSEESTLQDVIAEAKGLLTSASATNITAMAKRLEDAIEDYREEHAEGNIPTLTTNTFVPTGATTALMRFEYKSNKSTIKQLGVCWSTSPFPTVRDYSTTNKFTNRGSIYLIERLQPATTYYIRPYARTKGDQVAYGEQVKIVTLPKGNINYTWNYGGDSDCNKNVVSSLEEAKWLYDNLTYVRYFSVDAHYGSQTPTADCSYGGYMRIGPKAVYQQTGTILHEINHGVGVGESNEWWSDIYRKDAIWQGPRATKMIQFLNDDPTAYMTGDNVHMWPASAYSVPGFGINYGSGANPEDMLLLYGNVFITHALHQDGLICSTGVGFASPAYVMTQDDDTKYYIRNESTDCGADDSYLAVIDGKLAIAKAETATAMDDDAYAWYVTYDAEQAMYQIQNASTDQYIAFDGKAYTLSGTPSDLQLLPSWTDLQKGDFSKTTYWITSKYKAMQGSADGPVVATFSHAAPASQRWLIMTGDEASAYDKSIDATSIKSIVKDDEFTTDSKTYNIAGQRVNASYKGIVISNGRKYLKK